MKPLTARTTGTLRGVRFFHLRTFDRVKQIELNFCPARVDCPPQARIWHEVWEPRLRRFDVHVSLICQDDDLDLDGLEVIGRASAVVSHHVQPDLLLSVAEMHAERTDSWWRDGADRAVTALAETRRPFTVDDLRDLGVPEPDHANRWGGLFGAHSKRGAIRRTGRTVPSRHSPRNGSRVPEWIGATA